LLHLETQAAAPNPQMQLQQLQMQMAQMAAAAPVPQQMPAPMAPPMGMILDQDHQEQGWQACCFSKASACQLGIQIEPLLARTSK